METESNRTLDRTNGTRTGLYSRRSMLGALVVGGQLCVSPARSQPGRAAPPGQGLNLPYQPMRQRLYTRTELFEWFVPDKPESWERTADFAIYRHFVTEGRGTPRNPYVAMMQALHDCTITQCAAAFIAGRKVAGIMGGHRLDRTSPPYRNVAILARRLTRNGMLVCTGGGPGAMEAAHLGASLATRDDSKLDEALARLSTQPIVPELKQVVTPEGVVDQVLAEQAHAWFKPAYELAQSITAPGESLAIPTWHYGHEPTSPFATHIAKYFQNSIREEGLTAIAKQGIVYAEGKAGTMQEIFQDAAQNSYKTFGYFSPMVLLGTDHWTNKFPVVKVLENLFGTTEFASGVRVTDDVNVAAEFIEKFTPPGGRA